MAITKIRPLMIATTAIVAPLFGPAAFAQTSAMTEDVVAARDSADASEIIVTAQRRQERAQDVPIAITAFSQDRLQQQGITQAQGLQGTVPSLVVGNSGQRFARGADIHDPGSGHDVPSIAGRRHLPERSTSAGAVLVLAAGRSRQFPRP